MRSDPLATSLPGIVVSPEWFATHQKNVVTIDVRWYLDGRSGRQAFEKGHIPGAQFVDLDTELTQKGNPSEGRHPLPSPEHFAQAMAAHGIANDTPVVAYDDTGGMVAGRLVWMLRAQGTPAALLDGGILAYTGELQTGPAEAVTAVQRQAKPWPQNELASTEEIAAHAKGRSFVLLDARAPERYRGEVEPIDPRAGHLPGAFNLPLGSLRDPATGLLLSPEQLRARFAHASQGAIGPNRGNVVASCGSGVSACLLLVALKHAGLGDGRLFVPSWSGWSSDPQKPISTGDKP